MLHSASSLEVDLEFLREFQNWNFEIQNRPVTIPSMPACQQTRPPITGAPCCHCNHFPHKRRIFVERFITTLELKKLIGRVVYYKQYIRDFASAINRLIRILIDTDQGIRVNRQEVIEYVESLLRCVPINNEEMFLV